MIKNMPLETVRARILDDVNKIIWMAAPWRWTVGSLPAVTLASSTQDYNVALPSDYLYTTDVYISDGVQPFRTPVVVPILPTVVGLTGQPNLVAITGAANTTGTMRFSPVPGTLPATTKAYGLYKKTSPIITYENSNTAGVLVMDDEWFWVYEAGVLWLSYLYGDDQRAGSAQADGSGKVAYTGQRGVFEAALSQMREREKLPPVDSWRQPPDVKEVRR